MRVKFSTFNTVSAILRSSVEPQCLLCEVASPQNMLGRRYPGAKSPTSMALEDDMEQEVSPEPNTR